MKTTQITEDLTVTKIGYDVNGNSSIWISKNGKRSKKIQMNGVITDKTNIMSAKMNYFSNIEKETVKKSINEISDYYYKYNNKQ